MMWELKNTQMTAWRQVLLFLYSRQSYSDCYTFFSAPSVEIYGGCPI